MTVAAKKMETDLKSEISGRIRFDSIEAENYRFYFSYDDYKLQQLTDDSVVNKQVEKQEETGGLRTHFAALRNMEFTGELNETGKSAGMKGGDQFLALLDSIWKPLPEEVRMQLASNLRPLVNNDMVKGMIEQCFYVLPGKKVQVGDSWKNQINMRSFFSMIIQNEYKLLSIKDGIAELSIKSIIKPGNDHILMPGLAMASPRAFSQPKSNNGIELLGVNLKAVFEGTQEGKVWLETKTGLVHHSSMLQNLDGKIQFSVLEMPMSMHMTNRYEVLPLGD